MVYYKGRKPTKVKYRSVNHKSIKMKYSRIDRTISSKICGSNDNVAAETTDSIFPEEAIDENIVESNTYKEQKQRRIENWSQLEENLLSIGMQMNFVAVSECCCFCGNQTEEVYRCMDCGPSFISCLPCLTSHHKLPHVHMFEVFKNGTFVFVNIPTPIWTRPDKHNCGHMYPKDVVIIDEKGRQHKRVMCFCMCESQAETMMRSNLWPSSPKNPVLGFEIGLLEWMTALLLESQVSTRSFCEALKVLSSKHHVVDTPVKDVYKILMRECLVQYRQYKYRLRNPTHLCKNLGDGTQCPACYKNPQKVISMDADFQLVRKFSSGMNMSTPKHSGRFFLEQRNIDSFVQNYSEPNFHNEQDCSEFQAGSALRSKSKNKKLDETAVFGSVCRHSFPYLFFNLKHGERIAYSVYLLEVIKKQNPGVKLHITYDIACLLESHLKKKERKDLLDSFQLSIPIFHCYGHKMACQVLYSPRRTVGLGLTDGEGVERLWSYLGKFSSITKEMTPENRNDLLVDALLHYSQRTVYKLGRMCVEKIKRAQSLMQSSELALDEALTKEGVTRIVAEKWCKEEKQKYRSRKQQGKTEAKLSEEESYAVNLQSLNKLRQNLLLADNSVGKQKMNRKLCRLEKVLQKFEKGKERWTFGKKYQLCLSSAHQKQLAQMEETLDSLMAERLCLLNMIKKYARGQSVSLRIGKQIKSVNMKIKHSINEYRIMDGPKDEGRLTFDGLKEKVLRSDSEPSVGMKRTIIDLFEMASRCKEEVNLLKTEMNCIINYFCMIHESCLTQVSSVEGVQLSVIISEGLSCEALLKQFSSLFAEYISVPKISYSFHSHVAVQNTLDDKETDDILHQVANEESLLMEGNFSSYDDELVTEGIDALCDDVKEDDYESDVNEENNNYDMEECEKSSDDCDSSCDY